MVSCGLHVYFEWQSLLLAMLKNHFNRFHKVTVCWYFPLAIGRNWKSYVFLIISLLVFLQVFKIWAKPFFSSNIFIIKLFLQLYAWKFWHMNWPPSIFLVGIFFKFPLNLFLMHSMENFRHLIFVMLYFNVNLHMLNLLRTKVPSTSSASEVTMFLDGCIFFLA